MIEVQTEEVITVLNDGELVAVIHHDMKKKSQVFSACKEMGQDEVKELLININQKITQ